MGSPRLANQVDAEIGCCRHQTQRLTNLQAQPIPVVVAVAAVAILVSVVHDYSFANVYG
jgi:hypothetical protein